MTGPDLSASPGRASFKRMRVIATVLVAVLALATAGFSYADRTPDGHLMVIAQFKDASPLLVGNDVRTDGVKVGTITSITVEGRYAQVGMELDSAGLPVYRNMSLSIRPVSLLGERYVDLHRGTADHPVLADGARIPASQTGSGVGLDQVLNSLDQPTSAGLGLLINALGTGMDKNGDQVRQALKTLAPAMSQTSQITSVLRQQNQVLGQLVTNLAPVASALATNDGASMNQLVTASQQILATTATRDRALRQLLVQLPGTLATAGQTLGRLTVTARSAAPLLRSLRPTTKKLPAISRELARFAGAADPALKSATPLLQHLDALLKAARPDVRSLRAAGPSLRATATAARPITAKVTPHIDNVLNFLKYWALTTNGADAFGHYFRAGMVLSAEPVTGNLPGGLLPSSGSGTASGGGTQGGLNSLLGGVNGGLQGLLSGLTSRNGGVTGLTKDQENGLLTSLLGGN